MKRQCADKHLADDSRRERSSLYLALIFFFAVSTLYYAILRFLRTARKPGRGPLCSLVPRFGGNLGDRNGHEFTLPDRLCRSIRPKN